MDWNIFEIAQDKSKHSLYDIPNPRKMWFCPKCLKKGLRGKYEVKSIWIPYICTEILDMGPHNT